MNEFDGGEWRIIAINTSTILRASLNSSDSLLYETSTSQGNLMMLKVILKRNSVFYRYLLSTPLFGKLNIEQQSRFTMI